MDSTALVSGSDYFPNREYSQTVPHSALNTALIQSSIPPQEFCKPTDQETPILKPEPYPQQDCPPPLNDTFLTPQISVWRSNTTYLLCGNVAQIHPSSNIIFEDYPDERQQSLMINILIPPDESNPEKTFLSVTCQILETTHIPAEQILLSKLSRTSLSYL